MLTSHTTKNDCNEDNGRTITIGKQMLHEFCQTSKLTYSGSQLMFYISSMPITRLIHAHHLMTPESHWGSSSTLVNFKLDMKVYLVRWKVNSSIVKRALEYIKPTLIISRLYELIQLPQMGGKCQSSSWKHNMACEGMICQSQRKT